MVLLSASGKKHSIARLPGLSKAWGGEVGVTPVTPAFIRTA